VATGWSSSPSRNKSQEQPRGDEERRRRALSPALMTTPLLVRYSHLAPTSQSLSMRLCLAHPSKKFGQVHFRLSFFCAAGVSLPNRLGRLPEPSDGGCRRPWRPSCASGLLCEASNLEHSGHVSGRTNNLGGRKPKGGTNGCGIRYHKRDKAELRLSKSGPNPGDETGVVSSSTTDREGAASVC
jgi:hypothetical protein